MSGKGCVAKTWKVNSGNYLNKILSCSKRLTGTTPGILFFKLSGHSAGYNSFANYTDVNSCNISDPSEDQARGRRRSFLSLKVYKGVTETLYLTSTKNNRLILDAEMDELNKDKFIHRKQSLRNEGIGF